MCLPVSFPRLPGLKPLLAASLALLASHGLFAQSTDNSGTQSQTNQNDVSALKTQMQKIQKEYEDRISAMEAKMKALRSKTDSGSILNTRILTDADSKAVEGPIPALDESFLKSLTRNFTFLTYIRAGFEFNGNGGGGNFSFGVPTWPGVIRERLGNENDVYMELTWMQVHMLGDSQDVIDVSMTFTPAIVYQQSRNTFTVDSSTGVEAGGQDFKFVLRQAFLEMRNVFRGAPEITFWGGDRFYGRYNTDNDDYFWLDSSGYGAGFYNWDVGVGKIAFAWLGGLNDNVLSPGIGTFFRHTWDLRLNDIHLGPVPGKFVLVLIGNFEKGGTFTQGYDSEGRVVPFRNPVHMDSAGGIGGGAIYNVQFGPGGFNNSAIAYALFGTGATNFSSLDDLGSVQQAANLDLFFHPTTPAGTTINVGNPIQHSFRYRAGFAGGIALPWYHSEPVPVAGTSKEGKAGAPPPPRLPWLSIGMWANWQETYGGSAVGGFTGPGIGNGGNVVSPGAPLVSKVASGHVHNIDFGIRPAVWITDNIAFQVQFAGQYESNNFNGSTFPGFGARHGWMGIFDVGPVIKPKGGYFTKPELRFFATYAIWSNSLKGLTTPVQENGGGDFMPPYNGNTNHGWLFGTEIEWYL